MGRLIDADKAIFELGASDRDIYCKYHIEEQITAYDVEAVVKDIQDIGTRFCASVHCNDECECCDHGSMMKAIIEIVRNGGVK